MFFSKSLLVVSLALSASAASLAHVQRANLHRSIAHRAPEPVAEPEPAVVVTPRKRSNLKKRCIPHSSSASGVAPSSSAAPPPPPPASSSEAPAPAPSSSAAPDNVEAPPPVIASPSVPVSSPSHTHSPSPSPAPPPSPSPAPSPTPTPTPSPSQAPAPAPAPSSSSSSGGGPFYGDGTFYETGLGACGTTNTDADYIAAISYLTFDSFPGAGDNPNDNPICGKKLTATYQGKSVTVAIQDRCAGCEKEFSLDFSPTAFDQLADPSLGRISIEWNWD